MRRKVQYGLAFGMVALIVGVPSSYYRYQLTTHKRLRTIVPGRFYRSGQMTVEGFKDAVERYGIRTVVNVQNEFPDPAIRRGFLDGSTVSETDLCRQLNVNYVLLEPDLISRFDVGQRNPQVVADFLKVMDDPANYPILIHCKAGLHRTGCLVGVYRMEYQGWSPSRVVAEMKALGFGDSACTSANDYIAQYVTEYRKRPGPGGGP